MEKTIAIAKLFITAFCEDGELTQKRSEKLISTVFSVMEEYPESFSDFFRLLADKIEKKDIFFYIADAKTEQLPKILGQLQFEDFKELLSIVYENSSYGNEEINFNKLLLNFIEENEKESTEDFEQRVKEILRYSNGELNRKNAEIARLQEKLCEQIDSVAVLDKIKKPISDFEAYVQTQIARNSKDSLRLVQIAGEFRSSIKKLYHIDTCVPIEQWREQIPVPYDPKYHEIIDLSPEMSIAPESMVCVLTLGFSLNNPDGSHAKINSQVRLAETKQETKPAKNKPAPKAKPTKVDKSAAKEDKKA